MSPPLHKSGKDFDVFYVRGVNTLTSEHSSSLIIQTLALKGLRILIKFWEVKFFFQRFAERHIKGWNYIIVMLRLLMTETKFNHNFLKVVRITKERKL